MRTTLDLDEEVLRAVKDLARTHKTSLGKEVSRLMRQALQTSAAGHGEAVAGFEPFPAAGRFVSNDIVNRLRDEETV